MHLLRLTSTEHPVYSRAIELYRQSFPLHEQREEAAQQAALRCEDYHFDCILNQAGRLIGILLYWQAPSFWYVEHFCIDPGLRGHGYGRQALQLFLSDKQPVLLEIDPPVDDLSARRKAFYERAGLLENPYAHLHPPYRAGNKPHALVLLSYPQAVTLSEYQAFCVYLANRVMAP